MGSLSGLNESMDIVEITQRPLAIGVTIAVVILQKALGGWEGPKVRKLVPNRKETESLPQVSRP